MFQVGGGPLWDVWLSSKSPSATSSDDTLNFTFCAQESHSNPLLFIVRIAMWLLSAVPLWDCNGIVGDCWAIPKQSHFYYQGDFNETVASNSTLGLQWDCLRSQSNPKAIPLLLSGGLQWDCCQQFHFGTVIGLFAIAEQSQSNSTFIIRGIAMGLLPAIQLWDCNGTVWDRRAIPMQSHFYYQVDCNGTAASSFTLGL